jgi:hypothetical protein
MSGLIEIQDALIATLKGMQDETGGATFTTVEPWIAGDANDVEQVKGLRPPAAFVVFLSASDLDEAQEVTRWGVFIVTGGVRDKAERNRKAMNTTERVVDTIRNNRLGLRKISATKAIGIENLYSESLNRQGMGLYGLSFEIKRHR